MLGFPHSTYGATGRGRLSSVRARLASTPIPSSKMASNRATTEKGASVSVPSRGMGSHSHDLHRAATVAAPPSPEREATPLPPPPHQEDGAGGVETNNRGHDAATGDGAGPSAPPASPVLQRPRDGSLLVPPSHRDGNRATPSTRRRSAPGLPGVYNRNDALAMVRSLMEFPLLPDSSQYAAWHDRINALLDYSR